MVEVFVARLVRTANLDILNSAKRFCLTKLCFILLEYTVLCIPSRHTMLFLNGFVNKLVWIMDSLTELVYAAADECRHMC